MKYAMKCFFFNLLLLHPLISNTNHISLAINDFSVPVSNKDINKAKTIIQNAANTLQITSIISTLSAGIALLKTTYSRLTQSEKNLVKKCLALLVALWIASTQLFWICLYALGKFMYQFQDRTYRRQFVESIRHIFDTIPDKTIGH
jgi:hypothetical protein